MRGRSHTLMSNSSRCFQTGSEHTLTSELDTVLHSISWPWKRPACTTSWEQGHRAQVSGAVGTHPGHLLCMPLPHGTESTVQIRQGSVEAGCGLGGQEAMGRGQTECMCACVCV